MPCFNGLAVSIHTPDGPLPEYSIQKQFRFSRITSYIPVPPPTINPASSSSRREQSTFAISITLLTPGLSVPYSTPKPTPENPCPTPQVVGMLPGFSGHKKHSGVISSYVPLTTSPNETIAAYIYFDGRQKEEVATLLRRGEETWVNSRWVGIPESEGGGLAEREFLFREVGLERWLNGLDLEGKDAAAKIERRKRRMEKKRRNRANSLPSDDEMNASRWSKREHLEKDVLRYGADESSPLQKLSEDDELFSSDDDSDDDPTPETTGQIKIALFRVLASGEIKKGEYSPQFGAHDDDEDSMTDGQNGIQLNGDTSASGEADIDHTTSFAKPKSLDPRSISTQTVTGIDGPDKPYAVFTFLYRGESKCSVFYPDAVRCGKLTVSEQLQKMGILKSSKSKDSLTAPGTKRRSVQTDFANIKPLKTGGTVGFSSFRDNSGLRNGELFKSSNLSKQKQTGGRMDSDDDDDDDDDKPDEEVKLKDAEISESKRSTLSPEDAKQQGELAEGVKKIKVCSTIIQLLLSSPCLSSIQSSFFRTPPLLTYPS